jgi:hypothetical protein
MNPSALLLPTLSTTSTVVNFTPGTLLSTMVRATAAEINSSHHPLRTE